MLYVAEWQAARFNQLSCLNYQSHSHTASQAKPKLQGKKAKFTAEEAVAQRGLEKSQAAARLQDAKASGQKLVRRSSALRVRGKSPRSRLPCNHHHKMLHAASPAFLVCPLVRPLVRVPYGTLSLLLGCLSCTCQHCTAFFVAYVAWRTNPERVAMTCACL